MRALGVNIYVLFVCPRERDAFLFSFYLFVLLLLPHLRPPAVSRPSKLQFNRTPANRIHGPTDGRGRTDERRPRPVFFLIFFYYPVIYDTATRSGGPAASETFRNMASVFFFSIPGKFRAVVRVSHPRTNTSIVGRPFDDGKYQL